MIGTRLTGVCGKKRLVIRLRFGEPLRTRRAGDGQTHYWFQPGHVFAVLWWARLSLRKQVACFGVLEAREPGEAGYRLPAIDRAVRVHTFLNARCVGKDRRAVDRAEALIRGMEREQIDPCRVRSAYFRAAGQSLRVGHEPRRLDREAFLRSLRSCADEC